MYYYDSYWRVWVRRLLTLRGHGTRFIDISLTGEDAHEERIRVHSTQLDAPIENSFPESALKSMIEQHGAELAMRLLTFNYIQHYGLSAILEAKQDGGVPVSEVA